LAREVVAYVHGDSARDRAERTTEALFGGGDWTTLPEADLMDAFAASPTTRLSADALGTADAALAALLVGAGLAPSRGQARQAIKQGGLTLNNQPVADENFVVTRENLLAGRFAVIRRGKKSWHVVRVD
jgi:tyrosyl-tRNA synthetase